MKLPPAVIQSLILLAWLAAGYVLSKARVLGPGLPGVVSRLVVKLTLPALIFVSMLREYSPELLRETLILGGISFAVYGACILLSLFATPSRLFDEKEKGVFRFALVFSNVGFMGYPVMESLFGAESLFRVSVYNIAFQILCFSAGVIFLGGKVSERNGGSNDDVAKALAEEGSVKGRKGTGLKTALMLLVNPNIVAALAGLAFFLFRLDLPPPAKVAFQRLGDCTTPLSMVMIGSILARDGGFKPFLDWRVHVAGFWRILVLPSILYIVLTRFVPADSPIVYVPVMIAAMPVAANAAILAEEYGSDVSKASGLVFVSTVFSMVSIPFVASFFFGK